MQRLCINTFFLFFFNGSSVLSDASGTRLNCCCKQASPEVPVKELEANDSRNLSTLAVIDSRLLSAEAQTNTWCHRPRKQNNGDVRVVERPRWICMRGAAYWYGAAAADRTCERGSDLGQKLKVKKSRPTHLRARRRRGKQISQRVCVCALTVSLSGKVTWAVWLGAVPSPLQCATYTIKTANTLTKQLSKLQDVKPKAWPESHQGIKEGWRGGWWQLCRWGRWCGGGQRESMELMSALKTI